jgi:hypothetical protein
LGLFWEFGLDMLCGVKSKCGNIKIEKKEERKEGEGRE